MNLLYLSSTLYAALKRSHLPIFASIDIHDKFDHLDLYSYNDSIIRSIFSNNIYIILLFRVYVRCNIPVAVANTELSHVLWTTELQKYEPIIDIIFK